MELQEWLATINASKATLVFASSYLNSPSSMYGHTFLRFDPANFENDSPLLSFVVNFGASVNEADGGITYAFRGIFGGYPGYFAGERYYEKIKDYSSQNFTMVNC